jgi:hypothetical protein
MQLHQRSNVPTITSREIARTLDVTPLAILGWRRGSRDRAPLPVIYRKLGKARRVRITEDDLRSYLFTYRPDLLAIWDSR